MALPHIITMKDMLPSITDFLICDHMRRDHYLATDDTGLHPTGLIFVVKHADQQVSRDS
jgi:hypothetical protein